MNEPRLEARLIDWYAQGGDAAAPEPLREAVLGLPDRPGGAVALRRAEPRVWGRLGTSPSPRYALAAAAAVVVAIVGINLLSGGGLVGGPTASTTASSIPPSPSAPSASPSPAGTTSANPGLLDLTPGPFDIRWPGALIHLTLPAGWSSPVSLTSICRPDPVADPPRTGPDALGCSEGNRPNLAIHDVAGVVTDPCSVGDEHFEPVGPTVDDLTAALAAMIGPAGPASSQAMLGGFPARRFVLTDILDTCGGPEGRWLWQDADGSHFGLLKGGTATIYVVDVDGDRLVITTHERGASAEDVAELDAIVASMRIQPMAAEPNGDYWVVVDGVSFTVGASAAVFFDWGRFGNISVNKSIAGPQGAEAMVYWTAFPDGGHADPCGDLKDVPADASAGDLADAVSTAPGIELVAGPEDVTVGGRPAKHLVVRVREDLGCDPGYFFTWHDRPGGPMWSTTDIGDTIGVWIVDVDGTRLFIAGEIHRDLGPGQALSEAERTGLDREIQRIVNSIKFE